MFFTFRKMPQKKQKDVHRWNAGPDFSLESQKKIIRRIVFIALCTTPL
jgi:hypothetical protein